MENANAVIKVIGWTDYDDWYYPECEEVTDEVVDAIVDALIEGEYLFGGDAHQDHYGCCPVLSDGTRVAVSSRSWGGIMSMAYNKMHKGEKTNYMSFYMDMFIAESAHKYPPERVDESLITAHKTVHKIKYTHEIDDHDEFDRHIWMVPNTPEYADYKQGDYIDFIEVDGCPFRKVKVVCVETAPSFEELLPKALIWLFTDSSNLGLKSDLSKEEIAKELYKEFPRETVEKLGAIAIIFEDVRFEYE